MDQQWWKSAVVYQIYPRSFADADGDGVGDLRGIINHLDHVHALGADVVWLSPVYRSPMDDNGYDISDYNDVDPSFGTLADLDELIAGLHARGMKLVMDLVVNHTSDEHAWFTASRDKASDKRDWYIWRPARPGHEPGTPGAEPTNWSSFFGGPAWEFDEASGEYYLHLFSRKQPDLNWENPDVREAVYSMMRWWVERGVDGFRMDVINLISKTYPLTDGAVEPGQQLSFELAKVTDGPRLIEFLEEMNAAVGLREKALFTVGEMVEVDVERARAYTSEKHPRLNMVFTFEHMGLDMQPGFDKFVLKPLHLPDLKKNLASWQEGLAEEGWNSLYWDNHDQPRAVSRFGDDSPRHRVASAKTLATVLHLHRGTPYVYQGEELGMTNAGFTSIDQYRDIEALNYYQGALAAGASEQAVLAGMAFKTRDNGRTPMCWSDAPGAGFTTGTPWIEINANAAEINAASQVDDPSSVFAHYQRLIELRHTNEVVREGRFDLLLPEHERLWVFTRTWGDERLLVIANMSSFVVGVPMGDLPDLEHARLILTNLPGDADDVQTLEPWESRVYAL
ncbi:alpha-glucosidase [Propioniciclava tarda]|uniref:Alpha-glucosidase n=1 Tax=Propioniciclava tarda TaxID=433330 RepID=A0A4Q9KHX9_PROTD|nr:alpha-glucosidase [Propioniciclava tarda]TBT92124.1 alpha-glucosidase [Propioniciclava tarda]SMO83998.1 oligo-1,6-glucosidase [Propioniciclava tarda]